VGPIIVGVPGPWADQDEVLAAIGSVDGPAPFVAEDAQIIDARSGASLAFEVYPHDPRMEEAFAIASGGKLSKKELRSIAKHRATVYLLGRDCSVAGAHQVMTAAAHLLDVGGVGVKVESAGVAHAPDRFRYHARSGATLSAYRMFVTLVGGASTDHHYSCGMHNLGLPDVSVVGSVPVDEAAGILTTFNHWNLLEHPRLKEGAWFSCAEGEPAFTASHHPFGYEEDDPLNNPLGRWHLSPTDHPGPGRYAPSMNEPRFMALPRDSLIEAARRARATVGYLREQFASPYEYGRYMVKVRFRDGEESAFLWALLEEIDDQTFRASLFEVPRELAPHCANETIERPLSDLEDWAIIKSGTLVGGFSMRIQRDHIPDTRRHAYELYSGTLSYAPLEEIPGA